MQYLLIGLLCLKAAIGGAFEYTVQLENEWVSVASVRIMGREELGLHRDPYPQVVIASKGGSLTRLEEDGSSREINFPTGVAVFREADPLDQFHRTVNRSPETIELMVIQLKRAVPGKENLVDLQAAANSKAGCRHVPERDLPVPTRGVSVEAQEIIAAPYVSVFDLHLRN